MSYMIERYGSIEVYWNSMLDGGGRNFGQYFIPIVRRFWGRVDRVFEFCAGPGFIGFSLLAHGLCDSLCLADINPDAVEALKETVKRNNSESRVTVYLSNGLEKIPDHEKWDLVVGNPPHFGDEANGHGADLIRLDPGWKLHEVFYAGVSRFLHSRSSVVLLENYLGSHELTFVPFLQRGNLDWFTSLMYEDEAVGLDSHYFFWTRPRVKDIHSCLSPPRVLDVHLSPDGPIQIAEVFSCAERIRINFINDTQDWANAGILMPLKLSEINLQVAPRSTLTKILLVSRGTHYIFARPTHEVRECNQC